MIKGSLFTNSFKKSNLKSDIKKRCSILCIAAFFILTTIVGCKEDPGLVGSRFTDPDANLTVNSFTIGDIDIQNDPTYSGNLRSMSFGKYDDLLFGSINSTGFMRPSINQQVVDTFNTETDILQLRLIFANQQYGDTTAVANFSIYEISDIWRGNEVKYLNQINFNTSKKLGEFSVSNQDTILVDLDNEWTSRYAEFLNSDAANRDSLYRIEFPGLAIVPDDPDASKILFADVLTDDDNQNTAPDASGFVIKKPDDEVFFQRALDWASTIERSDDNPASGQNVFKIHNTLEDFISIDLKLNEEDLQTQNLANVELVLFENKNLLEQTLPSNHTRPSIETARIHILESEIDLAEQIFSANPGFTSLRDSVDNSFRFNITNFANSELFGNPTEGKFYVSVQTTNGLIFSTVFYNADAIENRRPLVNVTAVNTTN